MADKKNLKEETTTKATAVKKIKENITTDKKAKVSKSKPKKVITKASKSSKNIPDDSKLKKEGIVKKNKDKKPEVLSTIKEEVKKKEPTIENKEIKEIEQKEKIVKEKYKKTPNKKVFKKENNKNSNNEVIKKEENVKKVDEKKISNELKSVVVGEEVEAELSDSKKSECKLFFFLSNYSELHSIYNEKLDIQFDNIKELLNREMKSIGGEIVSSDYSSITISPKRIEPNELSNKEDKEKNGSSEFDFDDVLGVTYKIYEAIEYYYKLTVKYEFPLKFHCGILHDDSDLEKNTFRKNFLGMKKIDSSKKGKKKTINYSNNYLPFTLLSEKTALSIIENYNIFKSDFKSNIWYTDGIKVSESQRLNKIYLNRDEEDIIDKFINDREFNNESIIGNNNSNVKRKKLFLFSGELGSGKTKIIDEVINNIKNNDTSSETSNNNNNNSVVILKITEKKHTEKEYYLVVKIIESLIEIFKDELNIDVNEIIEIINSDNSEDINKNNLINIVRRYFDDLYLDKNGISFYNLSIRLKIAFTDFLKLFMSHINKPLTIIIDNYQYSNVYCENVLLSVFNKKFSNIFENINMVFVGRDKDMMFNIKNYEKLKYQIYKKYLLNLNEDLISKFLQLTFPHKKITKGLVEFILNITGGNFYTLKEYIQDLINKEVIFSTNRFLKIKKINNDEIPENLLEIYESKIDLLDKDTKNILMIISIIGDSFYLVDLENLLHLLNYSGDELAAIDNLLENGFINKLEDFYYFPESELRNKIYKKIPNENKILIHNLLGEIFEKKSMKNFSFKVFYNFLFANNFDKIYELLDEILLETHLNLNFNALKNIVSLTMKELDKSIKTITDKWSKKEKDKEIEAQKKKDELAKKVSKKKKDEVEKVLDENGEWISVKVEEETEKNEVTVEISETDKRELEVDNKLLNKYKKLWISLVDYKFHTQKYIDRVEPENYKLLENAIQYAIDIEDGLSLYKLKYKLSELYLSEKKYIKFNETIEIVFSGLNEKEEFIKFKADFLVLNTYYQIKKNIKGKWDDNLKSAKDIYLTLNIDPTEMEIYNKTVGLYYFKIADYQNSLKSFNLLLTKIEDRIDFVELLRILEFVSELSLNLKDYDNIELLYKKIINLCDDFGYFSKKMDYIVKLGVLYSYQNRLLQAINTINPVVSELGKYDNPKNSLALIDVYNKLGIIHQYHGENKPAEEYFNLAIGLSDSISNYDKRSFSFIRKAIFELFNYEYDEAIISLIEARNDSKKNELTSLNSVLKKIAELGGNSTIFEDLDTVISTIDNIEKNLIRTFDRNIVFEIYLILFRILYNKNHFLKIKTVLEPKMNGMISKVQDFNLVVEFKKISREVISGTKRKKRKIKADKKVHPVVKRRLNKMKRR